MMLDYIDCTNFYTAFDSLLPMHTINPDPFKSDSGLTYSLPLSRKRSRDYSFSGDRFGEDVSNQILQQQFEIDQFVSHHTTKLQAEIEYKRKRSSATIISALEETINKRLRSKEAEITKLTKINLALEENLKSISIETQIWRELALTNEATANALRTNLKQVLDLTARDNNALADDAESCCESNNDIERTLAEQDSGNNRMCKSCWKQESCVLLLPCRHLCLCTVCASSVNICPICKSTKKISVNVHLS